MNESQIHSDQQCGEDGMVLRILRSREGIFCQQEPLKQRRQLLIFFSRSGNVPDILCVWMRTTECARQAILDFNLAGKVKIIGYYTSEDILAAVEKVLFQLPVMWTRIQLGQYSVRQLPAI